MMGWIIVLSFFGFWISWYIYSKKKRKQPLVCIIGKDCNQVVRSKYNALFGVPNEVVGMVYYAATALGALLLWSGKQQTLFAIPVWSALVVAGGIAAASSIILLFIQAFVIRQWCDYCIASALVTLAIFVLEIM